MVMISKHSKNYQKLQERAQEVQERIDRQEKEAVERRKIELASYYDRAATVGKLKKVLERLPDDAILVVHGDDGLDTLSGLIRPTTDINGVKVLHIS